MLATHMAAVERALVAMSGVPGGAGHPLHQGLPREAFVRLFLRDHLGEMLAIGQGEVIGGTSEAREPRNQLDIVVYKKQFPRLTLGGDISAFLIESVVATVEIKSILNKSGLRRTVRAARAVKALPHGSTAGVWLGRAPKLPLCFVVAYDGPRRIDTIRNWLNEIHQTDGIQIPELPLVNDDRYSVQNPSIDGVFVLSRGFIQFDNLPIGFVTREQREQSPALRYYGAETEDGTLLAFFLFLTYCNSSVIAEIPDLTPYITSFNVRVVV